MTLPRFVQSPRLLRDGGCYHAFLGVDPVPGRRDAERLRRVFAVPPDRVGTLRQVHAAAVRELSDADLGGDGAARRAGDALWTDRPGHGVGVLTADCVPLLIAHPGEPLCAAVHAGWRGLAAGIIGETVRALAARLGEGGLSGIAAAAGPSARGCCYEVGEEVAEALRVLPGGGKALRPGAARGKWTADLPDLVLSGLAAAGIPASGLEATGPCTVCSRGFHSYRRDRAGEGRQLSFIVIP